MPFGFLLNCSRRRHHGQDADGVFPAVIGRSLRLMRQSRPQVYYMDSASSSRLQCPNSSAEGLVIPLRQIVTHADVNRPHSTRSWKEPHGRLDSG